MRILSIKPQNSWFSDGGVRHEKKDNELKIMVDITVTRTIGTQYARCSDHRESPPAGLAGVKDTPRAVAEEVTYKSGDLPTFALLRTYCTATAFPAARCSMIKSISGSNLFSTGVRRWSSSPVGFAATVHL
jgi:hypothetical protein